MAQMQNARHRLAAVFVGADGHADLNSVQASFQVSMLCLTGVLRMKILPSL
jgi:hypothetical protein